MLTRLTPVELTRIWRAPWEVRLQTVQALEDARRDAGLLRGLLAELVATIRGLPFASLPATQQIAAIFHRDAFGGGEVWLRAEVTPDSGSIDGLSGLDDDDVAAAVASVRARMPFGGLPLETHDGPCVIDWTDCSASVTVAAAWAYVLAGAAVDRLEGAPEGVHRIRRQVSRVADTDNGQRQVRLGLADLVEAVVWHHREVVRSSAPPGVPVIAHTPGGVPEEVLTTAAERLGYHLLTG